jgi:electron transport complex protein RnfA
MGDLITILITVVFVKNFVLAQFLGLCPFIGVSKKTDTALGMGMAVVFVMVLASIVCWLVHLFLLAPSESNLVYQIARLFGSTAPVTSFNYVLVLRTISYIIVIAVLVQFVEMFIKKSSPPLYDALGIYLPLITTNCALLGVVVLNSQDFFLNSGEGAPVALSLPKAIVQGFGGGAGFMLAMLLMSGIRERLESAQIPESLKGVPSAFVCTSCMALAFGGFSGIV